MKKVLAVILSVVMCCMFCVGTSANFNIDRIHVNNNELDHSPDVKGDDPITIEKGDKLYILGWAYGENSNLSEIVYTIDDGEFVSCQDNYRDRMDVAAAFGLDASFGVHAGFGHDNADQGGMLELTGIDELSEGSYVLSIIAVYADDTYDSREFNLVVGSGGTDDPGTDDPGIEPIEIIDLPVSESDLVRYSFDAVYINDLNNPAVDNGSAGRWIEDNPINDILSALRVRGWALINYGEIVSFGYQIDDGPYYFSPAYIYERPDVQAAFGAPAEVAKGFDITIDVENIELGEHTARIFVGVDDGGAIELTSFEFTQADEKPPVVAVDQWLCGWEPGNMSPNWWFNPVGEPDDRYVEFYFNANSSFSGIHGFYYCSNPVADPSLEYAVMNVELIKDGETVAVEEFCCVGDDWADVDFGSVFAPGEYSLRYSCKSGSGIENNCWCVIGGTAGAGEIYCDSYGVNISNPYALPCIMLKTVNFGDYYDGLLHYSYYGDHYAVTGCDESASGEVIILDSVTVDGFTFPVTSIEWDAFYNRPAITNIIIPDSVTDIYAWAFERCSGLTSITIPKNVTYLDKNAFYGCDALENIEVDEDNSLYSSHNGVVYNKTKTRLILCPYGKTGVYEIPDTVTVIDNKAFANCDGLTNVTIPDSVTYMGIETFYSCGGLTNVTIPSSVTSIVYHSFSFCTNLEEIEVPVSVTEIEEGAFQGCSNLKTVKYEGTEEQWNNIYIAWNNYYLLNADIIFNWKGMIPGDCNNDGSLDNKDVVVLFRYVSGTNKVEDESIYDFNGDGSVDNKDVVALFRHVSSLH